MPVRPDVQAEIIRSRVTVALYLLDDSAGLACDATDAELAVQAGLTVAAVRQTLRGFERDRTIVALAAERHRAGPPYGPSRTRLPGSAGAPAGPLVTVPATDGAGRRRQRNRRRVNNTKAAGGR